MWISKFKQRQPFDLFLGVLALGLALLQWTLLADLDLDLRTKVPTLGSFTHTFLVHLPKSSFEIVPHSRRP